MGRLDGKVALVTGGGGAIGGAQAELFASEGARVVVADLFLDKAAQVASRLDGRGLAVELDVRSSRQWASAIESAEREIGPVNILCNNAGANVRVGFDAQTEDMWHLIVDTILTGSFLGIKAVVPSMRRARRRGHRQSGLAGIDPARRREPGVRVGQDGAGRAHALGGRVVCQ